MDFEFVRGDTCPISWPLKDANGNDLMLEDGDEMYFTVKESYKKKEFKIQKRFSKGEITYENNKYHTVFEHEDTAKLKFGTYEYDIQIKSGNLVSTAGMGTITLTPEVTHIENE